MTDGGNVKVMTVMGEALVDGLSDAGSTPARSTKSTLLELLWLKNLSRSSKLTYSWNCLWYKGAVALNN